MSAVPPPYTPQTSFSTEAERPIVTAGLPGAELDQEFTNVQETVNAIRSRLGQIQRDDGQLANQIVGFEALAPEILQFAISPQVRLRGPWTPNTPYVFDGTRADVFVHAGATRITAVTYVSGATYGILDETFTGALGNPPSVGTIVRDVFTGNGVTTAFTMTSDPVSSTNLHVYVNGLLKVLGTDFTLVNKVVTFTTPPANLAVIVTEAGVVTEVNLTTVADGTITSAKLAFGSVTSAKIGAGAVATAGIADGAVTTPKIGAAAVTTAKIENGAVTADKIGLLAVTSDKFADGSVNEAKLASGAVTTAKIATSAVATDSLADSAVSAAKLASNAVTTAKILDANVTTSKLADGAVTAAKIADGSITSAKLSGAFTARAWATFDGLTAANKTGTYSQTGTAVTVSVTAHGFRAGHSVYLDFTSGTATDALFTVATVIDANNFTVARTTATTSGNVTLPMVTIAASGNVSNIVKAAVGDLCVNFTADMPSTGYALIGDAISNTSTSASGMLNIKGTSASFAGPIALKTISTVAILTGDSFSSTLRDMKEATFVIFA